MGKFNFWSKEPIPSGIDNYDERVEYVEQILYLVFKYAYKIDDTPIVTIESFSDKLVKWIKWPDQEKINVVDAYILMYKKMDLQELQTWHKRISESHLEALSKEKELDMSAASDFFKWQLELVDNELSQRK